MSAKMISLESRHNELDGKISDLLKNHMQIAKH
jgi:hypothetical protein